MVQDSVYCFHAKKAYDIAARKATDVQLKEFLEKKSESYTEYCIPLKSSSYTE